MRVDPALVGHADAVLQRARVLDHAVEHRAARRGPRLRDRIDVDRIVGRHVAREQPVEHRLRARVVLAERPATRPRRLALVRPAATDADAEPVGETELVRDDLVDGRLRHGLIAVALARRDVTHVLGVVRRAEAQPAVGDVSRVALRVVRPRDLGEVGPQLRAEPGERGRQIPAHARGARDPLVVNDAVAPVEDAEPARQRAAVRVRGAVLVEHDLERGHRERDGGASGEAAAEERPSPHRPALLRGGADRPDDALKQALLHGLLHGVSSSLGSTKRRYSGLVTMATTRS